MVSINRGRVLMLFSRLQVTETLQYYSVHAGILPISELQGQLMCSRQCPSTFIPNRHLCIYTHTILNSQTHSHVPLGILNNS